MILLSSSSLAMGRAANSRPSSTRSTVYENAEVNDARNGEGKAEASVKGGVEGLVEDLLEGVVKGTVRSTDIIATHR